ncbi:uncharacterized protein LOC9647143 [Selaginella moellendorffii]|nr:uncharacterized protein LOC9647143 [Selaginella moellendorffii]|eukprot:XP_002962772.2 uncharacterized protein LOC9647143 [Selaginella moellendorffii]
MFAGKSSFIHRGSIAPQNPHLAKFPSRALHFASPRAEKSLSSSSTGEIAAIAGTSVAIPVVAWSLFTLKTTGCGLPPGPGGSLGALEGVSYLAIGALIAWSIYTKAKTGSGLPSGPYGLLGAVEGASYLVLLGALVVFGLQFIDHGYIPGPLPNEQCYG